jgi:phosphohistidine phosphatase
MLLYLVRHGIAIDRDDPHCPPEADRFLTEEGLEKTAEVAKGVAALIDAPEIFISSPYVRAWQTAEIFAAAFHFKKNKIRKTEALLPGAEASAIYRELAKSKDAESAMCFGHAPHLDEAIAAALRCQRDATSMKKAGVACIELHRISPPTGTLAWLATPRILKRVKT